VNAGAAPTLTPGNPTPSVDNTVQPQPTASLWGVAEQVAQHIERLVYERERNSLTVRLDPPELGVVELRFQATGGEVQAWLSAERDLTRQLLQQAQQYLREQLESRGLQLTHFDVGAQRSFQHAPYEQSRSDATAISLARTAATINNFVYDGRWSIWV
jgi:flagellar hook-length control protein FliK